MSATLPPRFSRSENLPSAGFLVALAVLLALAHAVLALTATVEKSMTSDEIAHLTAGQAYNTFGDFRLQPENGNLPQRWVALPATLGRTPLPPTSTSDWREADVWNYGHAFFYERAAPAGTLLFAGRAMVALFSAAIGLLVFFWSRSLFGRRGAFLSLLLLVLCPSFLAHGALATSDIVMTFFFLAAVSAWWRHLERPGTGPALLSALVFSLACVAKFSAVFLVPMFGLIALVWVAGRTRAEGWRTPLLRLVRSSALHAAVAWATIWLFYGFRFEPFTPGLAEGANYNHGWGWLLSDLGWPRPIIVGLKEWHALPDAFLYGFTFVVQFAKQRGAFLNGEYSIHGWPGFFPYAFLVKTTIPFLLLLAATAVVGWRRLRPAGASAALHRLRPLTPLLVLFAVYWAVSVTSHLNIGHRHILPIYPVLFIAAGAAGTWLDLRRPLAVFFVGALVLWHGVESWRIRPHYLAYFNAFAGGPANGWRHLVDSSLDWGQDLPGLQRWLDAHAPRERVFLAYFGTGDPEYEGIRATMLPTLPEVGLPRRWHALAAGVYAVSATMLQQVYSPVHGDWTQERENEFQQLRALEPLLLAYQNDPLRRAELLRDAPAEKWTSGWKRYELLRFARLCHVLRARTADASIGYSIRVYRLSAADFTAATGTIHEWRTLIERAVGEPRE
ncbi:MAG: phospholipid carrier-dependent glycosyltransferase [Opitutus sp.]|nr:phospholipid carrier-dependent glycosyltransferase [Opitutus sp.]